MPYKFCKNLPFRGANLTDLRFPKFSVRLLLYKTRHVEISEGRRRHAVSTSLCPLSCLIWEGVLTISPLFESLSLCALFTEWWVFTLARARLCFLPFYQSPLVPFHSILPRSRHCSVFPFIRNKVSSGRAQCTPVFLGFLYLFLSSSPFAHASFAKSLQPIVATSRIDAKSLLPLFLSVSASVFHIHQTLDWKCLDWLNVE